MSGEPHSYFRSFWFSICQIAKFNKCAVKTAAQPLKLLPFPNIPRPYIIFTLLLALSSPPGLDFEYAKFGLDLGLRKRGDTIKPYQCVLVVVVLEDFHPRYHYHLTQKFPPSR